MKLPEGPPKAPAWFTVWDVEGWFYCSWQHGGRGHNTAYFATEQEAKDAAEVIMATQGYEADEETSERISNAAAWGLLFSSDYPNGYNNY